MESPKVAIIGAGIQGLFCALYLADVRSCSVEVVDFRDLPGGLSSSRSAAMVTRITMDGFLSNLAMRSIAEYESLESRFPDIHLSKYFRRRGFGVVAIADEHIASLARHSVELADLEAGTYLAKGAAVGEASGLLHLPEHSIALISDDDGWIVLDGLLADLRSACTARGVVFRNGRRCVAIGVDRDNYVESVALDDSLQIACDAVVNAAGVFAGDIAGMVGRDLVIEASLKNLVSVPGPVLQGSILEVLDDGYYFRHNDGGVLVGVGLGETVTREFLERNLEPTLEDERLVQCQDYLLSKTSIPEAAVASLDSGSGWAGYRPMPADNSLTDRASALPPIFGHPRDSPDGYFESAGWGEFGITLGPYGGKTVAQAVLEFVSNRKAGGT